ncbi:MAG: (d)CMP kinase [Pseudomonadota bacterium]|nr:(d)CMP kinase [Pseudomonadota bacterium]
MNNDVPIIAVDGPGGVGKGTLCQLLAVKLGWNLLDSGSLYRITAYAAKQKNINLKDSVKVSELSKNLNIQFKRKDQEVHFILDGIDISCKIRNESISLAASIIAADSDVRKSLITRQQAFAISPGLVADGRDMGSVVFPGAKLKIFLTADISERAQRRYKQLNEKGIDVSLPALSSDMKDRDERDRDRSVAPLKACEDARILDSSGLSIERVFETALGWAQEVYPDIITLR